MRRAGFSLADLRIAGFSGTVLRMSECELKGALAGRRPTDTRAAREWAPERASERRQGGARVQPERRVSLQPSGLDERGAALTSEELR